MFVLNSNKKILILAIFLGLLTVFGLNYYINTLKNNQVDKGDYSQIIVATNTIPANVKITAEMVTSKSVATESKHPESITSTEQIIGGITKSEIVNGEQILSSKVVVDGAKATLAYRIPENMRAVSIPTNEITGVAGFINVGDKIDILATYSNKEITPDSTSTSYTHFQSIEVVAVGNAKQGAPEKQTDLPASLTILVNPQQAEVIVYALSNGALHFTLRNPADSTKVDLDLYNTNNFSTYKER